MTTLTALLIIVLAVFAALLAAVPPLATLALGIWLYLRKLLKGPLPEEKKTISR